MQGDPESLQTNLCSFKCTFFSGKDFINEAKVDAARELAATARLTTLQEKALPPEAFSPYLLYEEAQQGYITLFTKPDSRAFHIHATQPREAACLATPLSTRGKDVYFGIGLRRENLGDNNEERMKTLSYLPGLWADLDIQGPSHKRKELSPSQEEVLQFPDASFPLSPCIVIFSKYGFRVYWLFKELLLLETPSDRERAVELLRRL